MTSVKMFSKCDKTSQGEKVTSVTTCETYDKIWKKWQVWPNTVYLVSLEPKSKFYLWDRINKKSPKIHFWMFCCLIEFNLRSSFHANQCSISLNLIRWSTFSVKDILKQNLIDNIICLVCLENFAFVCVIFQIFKA